MEYLAVLTEQVLPLAAYGLCALVLTMVFTMLCIKVLPRLGLIDKPGGHHIHVVSVPRGGGIAIFLSFVITLGIYFAYVSFLTGIPFFTYSPEVPIIVCGATLIFILGLVDDWRSLKAKTKLLGQVIVALVSWKLGIRFEYVFQFTIPDWASVIFTVIWFVAFINAFNLIDGIDGLASGLGAVACLCLTVWFAVLGAMDMALLLVVLCAGCLGFLRFNFSPARIFMGDSGSMLIGYVIGAVGLCSVSKAATFTAVIIPVLAAGIPIFDEFLAVWRRGAKYILNKIQGFVPEARVMSPDREHIHHRLLKKSGHHSKAALILYVMGVCCAALATVLMFIQSKNSWLAFAIVMALVWFAVRRIGAVELWSSAQMLQQSFRRPRRGLFFAMAMPVCDVICFAAAYIVAFWVDKSALEISASTFLFTVAFILSMLIVFGIYKTYWLRSGIRAFAHLTYVIILALALGGVLGYFFFSQKPPYFFEHYFIFSLISLLLLFFYRGLLLFVERELIHRAYVNYVSSAGTAPRRAMLYGGGLNARLFLDYNTMKVHETNLEVIGIIDDDPSIKNMNVQGLRVYGKSLKIAQIYSKHKFGVLVVTSANIPPEKLAFVKGFCQKRNIELLFFTINLNG